MNRFRYELRKGNGSIFTTKNLNWFERLRYQIKGYEVIELPHDYWNIRCNKKEDNGGSKNQDFME